MRASRSLPLLLLLPLVGCGFAVDTPLGVEDVPASVAPGQDVTGTVIWPDGDITVTIGRAETGLRQDERVSVHEPCEYDDERLTCPTTGLTEGVYAVQVTDAAVPSELVKTAYVAVTDRRDYEPGVTTSPEYPTSDEPFDAVLTGWGAEQELVVRVSRAGRVVERIRLVTDETGRVELALPAVRRGAYEVRVQDGIWGEGEAPAYVVWLPS